MHDSHAEVIAKRAFVLYLIEELNFCLQNDVSVFRIRSGKFVLRDGVKFHFYSSHPPCGDATIAPKCDLVNENSAKSDSEPEIALKRIHADDDDSEEALARKRQKTAENDIHRTGAKAVNDVDPRGEGADYHVVGAVRTKPGTI